MRYCVNADCCPTPVSKLEASQHDVLVQSEQQQSTQQQGEEQPQDGSHKTHDRVEHKEEVGKPVEHIPRKFKICII